MKVLPKTTVGIEVAGDDLRIAVLREFAGKRRLIRMDTLAGFAGLTDEDKATGLVGHFKKHGLSGYNVHLTLPGTSGLVRDLEFPTTVGTGDPLRSAVALQIENLSPWALDEIYWDCVWEQPAKSARSIIVHIGIVPRAVLDPWIALFRSTRLALTGASLSSLSWAHGVAVMWGNEQPAMVLSAETLYVEGALIREGRVYATNMPGGNHGQLVPASASQLLRLGRVDSVEQVRLVGHGAGRNEAGLGSTALPIEGSTTVDTSFGAVCTALLGLVRSGFRLNLIPSPLRYQRNYLQLVPTYALIVLLLVLAVFAWIREPYQQSLYAQQLTQEVQRLSVEVQSVADQESQLNRISDRLKVLDGLTRARDANLEALRELTRVLPQNTWLTSYAYQDNTITISGVSESAASMQRLLEESPVFRDAQFTSSISRESTGKDRFNLRAAIEVRP